MFPRVSEYQNRSIKKFKFEISLFDNNNDSLSFNKVGDLNAVINVNLIDFFLISLNKVIIYLSIPHVFPVLEWFSTWNIFTESNCYNFCNNFVNVFPTILEYLVIKGSK